MNNLDLAVFPSMSKAYTEVLRRHSNAVAPRDEIFAAAQSVWEDLPSCTIARGFLLAYRLAELVIKHKGGNEFLRDSSMHTQVRNDFYDTQTGIKPKIVALDY